MTKNSKNVRVDFSLKMPMSSAIYQQGMPQIFNFTPPPHPRYKIYFSRSPSLPYLSIRNDYFVYLDWTSPLISDN